MKTPLCAILVALIAGQPAAATLVMFQWTPERVLLAADSLATRVHDNGAIDTVTECKIHQQGNFFFTIVGIIDDPAAHVDLLALADRAAAGARDLNSAVRAFELAMDLTHPVVHGSSSFRPLPAAWAASSGL